MTDKQIIIDGVDVSRCEFLQQEDIDLDYTCYAEEGYQSGEICCSACPNCYYKQLKRKEQECEELKKIINEAKNSKLDLKSFLVGEAVQNEYEQQLDQLKAENKHLNDLLNQALKELEKTRKD